MYNLFEQGKLYCDRPAKPNHFDIAEGMINKFQRAMIDKGHAWHAIGFGVDKLHTKTDDLSMELMRMHTTDAEGKRTRDFTLDWKRARILAEIRDTLVKGSTLNTAIHDAKEFLRISLHPIQRMFFEIGGNPAMAGDLERFRPYVLPGHPGWWGYGADGHLDLCKNFARGEQLSGRFQSGKTYGVIGIHPDWGHSPIFATQWRRVETIRERIGGSQVDDARLAGLANTPAFKAYEQHVNRSAEVGENLVNPRQLEYTPVE